MSKKMTATEMRTATEGMTKIAMMKAIEAAGGTTRYVMEKNNWKLQDIRRTYTNMGLHLTNTENKEENTMNTENTNVTVNATMNTENKEEKNMTTATENTNVTVSAPGQNKEEEKKAMEAKKQAEKEAKAQAKKAEQEKKAAEKAKKAEQRKAAAVKKAQEKKAEQEKKAQEKKGEKENVRKEMDSWLEQFKADAEKAGHSVVIKTWENIPLCRSLKVDGVTYFEMYYSVNGIRMNAKSELIPENLRPEGSTIVKNGLDLCIPTFRNVAEGLTKYADACKVTLAAKKAEKEKALAEKEAAKKAEKEAKAKAKAEAKAKKEQEKAAKKEADQKAKAAEKAEEQ